MEIQLQELIDKIKSDGVAAAEEDAAKKRDAADAEARKIVADAKAEAARIEAASKEENDRLVKASEEAIRQAARNILIEFREGITRELDAILKAEVDQAYSRDMLASLIPKVVTEWVKHTDAQDIQILLNSEDLAALESGLTAELKAKVGAGVVLKAADGLEGGFRIAEKDGTAYYDYSADAVADLFAAYLNPRISAIMKEAVKL
ncbi:MAG: hypothetical protein PUA70_07535 [Oribacterium sp.]|nr:hypothetical protein [Oribacterium sp.]